MLSRGENVDLQLSVGDGATIARLGVHRVKDELRSDGDRRERQKHQGVFRRRVQATPPAESDEG